LESDREGNSESILPSWHWTRPPQWMWSSAQSTFLPMKDPGGSIVWRILLISTFSLRSSVWVQQAVDDFLKISSSLMQKRECICPHQ
jgi:hypothetical protein